MNALEVIGHTYSSLRVSVYVILIFFIERNEIYYYEQLHKRANTISIRFIDTGKRFTGKECQRNFNILFVNNLIKGKVPRKTSTDTGFFARINCNT